jgi:hypothetical protein
MLQYTTETQPYTSDGNNNIVDSQCSDILFFNNTTGTVYINGFPVASGGVYKIDSNNPDEMNITKYLISFSGSTGTVYVTRKKYLPKK